MSNNKENIDLRLLVRWLGIRGAKAGLKESRRYTVEVLGRIGQQMAKSSSIDDVHMGMRVEAVWKPREEWDTSVGNIKYFRANGEPDAPFESYKEHI